ncbi:SRPBCC family protein [Sinomonas terrae]|uniref:SRPBCC family protein n=1 Tax=Sinomonas terrae TaxID=2908838 RepID=A0ABS9U3R1_9MICC|nr:SRPBCC family protein [Sinomonas terrae]MCH6471290.1 SRPBCC family protein [Sinomonas terrae]
MATVRQSVDVNVPVSQAYNQWTQFESFPEFMGGVESVVQRDDTHLHWTTKVAGQTREFDTVVTEQQPDQRVAWNSVDGVEHAGVVTFESLGPETTRINVEFQWDPDSAVEKIGSFFGADDLQVRSDLKKFKEFIESRGTETGAWRGQVDSTPQSGEVFGSGTNAAGTESGDEGAGI